MRCKNCGWPNKPNETNCVKCGSQLDNESQAGSGNVSSSENYSSFSGADEDGRKKTVMETDAFGVSSNVTSSLSVDMPESPTVAERICPKCGYPMRADATKCPNCNFSQVNTSENQEMPSGGYIRRPTRMSIHTTDGDIEEPLHKNTRKSTVGGASYRGTVNPYMMDYQAEPAFILEPMQRLNERKPLQPVEFEGAEVRLTRENTESANPTISSKEQAVITHENGQWYIQDCSEQRTTFVQAGQKMELHDGDIILLGNRLFKFTEQ